MSHPNPSISRHNSIINPVGQTSLLNRGPSPSLNNIPEDESQSKTPTNSNQTRIFLKSNDDITSLLKCIETTLNRTNERLEAHEKDLNLLKRNRMKSEQNYFNLLSPYVQYILIIIVAIILKYIFR
jgi:hypothetical protein